MGEQGPTRGAGSGPGNKRIAMTLLEVLAARGDSVAHARAMRASGVDAGRLAETGPWLPEEALGDMFASADVGPAIARSVGHRLVSPDTTGLGLYGLGLATPEKAYRRIGSWLPRMSPASSWQVEEIGSGRARLTFHPAREGDRSGGNRAGSEAPRLRGAGAACAVRKGMLEVVPCLYGLLPARVEESTCLARGGDACRYEIAWRRGSRRGLLVGGCFGVGLAAATLVLANLLGPPLLPLLPAALIASALLVLGATVGRSFDLAWQLEAVGGARRGHLALFDQVDDVLAGKLDALARIDAKLEEDAGDPPLQRSGADARNRLGRASPGGRDPREIPAWAQRIHGLAGDLECWFDGRGAAEPKKKPQTKRKETGKDGRERAREPDLDPERARVREIRQWAERIAREAVAEEERPRSRVDLVALVRRAIASVRPSLPLATRIHLEHDESHVPTVCEPVQIEQVVVQLLRNAVEASQGLSDAPEIFVSVRRVEQGIELAVEDRGAGIEPAELDEVFDPFFAERRAGVDEGFGLPVCLRIVEAHGGELRIEAEDRPGTRVSILLPESGSIPRERENEGA
ncbi:MAG TPA: HAMP domain-containing histidine kinase [Deltaproteobacteria bacterium]|nr:HAMP domain-containing histidine kinase [Deltaproteobacteria bacterium]